LVAQGQWVEYFSSIEGLRKHMMVF
jgi:hypothetical protein